MTFLNLCCDTHFIFLSLLPRCLRHTDKAELVIAAVSKQCPDTRRCMSTRVLIEGSHLVSANQALEKREVNLPHSMVFMVIPYFL
jgi:hypothetical protein